MKSRGSVTQLFQNHRPGYILSEDGCLVAFDETSSDWAESQKLSVGDWVEYDELEPTQRQRATNMRPV